jgi:hypothetical protein
MNAATIAAIRMIASKLTQRSSIAGIVTLVLGIVGINKPELAAQIAGVVASLASIALVLIDDKTFARLLASGPEQASAPVRAVTTPPPAIPTPPPAASAAPQEATPMSLLSSVAGAFANLNPVVSAALNAVTLVEALFPTAPGVQKLAAAQAYVGKAIGTAEDVTSTIEGVLASLKSAGVISSGSQSQASVVAPAA